MYTHTHGTINNNTRRVIKRVSGRSTVTVHEFLLISITTYGYLSAKIKNTTTTIKNCPNVCVHMQTRVCWRNSIKDFNAVPNVITILIHVLSYTHGVRVRSLGISFSTRVQDNNNKFYFVIIIIIIKDNYNIQILCTNLRSLILRYVLMHIY